MLSSHLVSRLILLACLLPVLPSGCRGEAPETPGTPPRTGPSIRGYLVDVFDRYHAALDVWTDVDAAGNHFTQRSRMSSPGAEECVPPMNEGCTDNPYSGSTCIQASLIARGSNWGGWYFSNGVFVAGEKTPGDNWGTFPAAGVDLSGSDRLSLSFFVRGAQGGEKVEFFCFGVGRDPRTGESLVPYPDSSPRISTGLIRLSTDWREHTIAIPKGTPLNYVLGGFGWAASAVANNGRSIKFYCDSVRFSLPQLDKPRFAVSYEADIGTEALGFDHTVARNTAYTYDQALLLIVFDLLGDTRRADLLARALIYAMQNDRFYSDNRLRNAYQGGDLTLPPGWAPTGSVDTVRMPGWYKSGIGWLEDGYSAGTRLGPLAWVMLAFIQHYRVSGQTEYLQAAQHLSDWVETNCRDSRGAGGYTAGTYGFEPQPIILLNKSTEENLDFAAANRQLFKLTGELKYAVREAHATAFIKSCWDKQGKFWAGVGDDGITIQKSIVPVDVQAWGVLFLGSEYAKALDYAEEHHRLRNTWLFDFNEDKDGGWLEGSASMAAAYYATGQTNKWQDALQAMRALAYSSGALPAATVNGLSTGFYQSDGQPILYYRRPAVAASTWFYMAEKGCNPFYLGGSALRK